MRRGRLEQVEQEPKDVGPAAGKEDVALFFHGGVVRPKKHADLFLVNCPGGPITLERLEPPVERLGVMAADVGGVV
ncbi:hypothetical protein MRX96_025987 [Rhipicephalus microplus]